MQDREQQNGVPPLDEWKPARLVPPDRPEKNARGECRAGRSPGLAEVLADGLGAPDRVIFDDPPGPAARVRRHVDRREFVAALAARQGVSERVAAASVRIAEALRATADEYPDLTDAEAIEALRAMEAGVHRAGVPRRQ